MLMLTISFRNNQKVENLSILTLASKNPQNQLKFIVLTRKSMLKLNSASQNNPRPTQET